MANEDEDVLLELIDATKNKLEEEKSLLKLLQTYNEIRRLFLTDPDNGKLAAKLVKISLKLQSEFENCNFVDVFSKELLEEIAFFCHVGKNDSIQK